MADQSDVEAALAAQVAAALYPLGTQNGSVTGAVYRIYRGWPANMALEADLAVGTAHVSVIGIASTDTAIEQFPAQWCIPNPVTPALTVVTVGSTVTFGGAAVLGQLAGILVNDEAFAYRTQRGDTPAAVAANLAELINQVSFATVNGAGVTVLGAARLIGRVVADQGAQMVTRRQRQDFRLTCWCADPAGRDALAAAIDGALAQIAFLPMPDGTAGRLRYVRSDVTDDLSTLALYRRELTYSVEYAATLSQTQPSMLFGIFANDSGPTLHLS